MILAPPKKTKDKVLQPVKNAQWEIPPTEHYGYADDEERRAKRGLEDWEMVSNHTSNEIDPSTIKWVRITLASATIITVALYLFGIKIKPANEDHWLIGAYREEIFSVIFFFIFLYTSMLIKLIHDNKKDEKKAGERWALIGVLVGVLIAIIIGLIQIFLGYLL